MEAQVQDKWARITIDRETLARLKRLAGRKSVSGYLRELSLENPRQKREEALELRLATVEQKLGINSSFSSYNSLSSIIDPVELRRMADECTRETFPQFINDAFDAVDLMHFPEREANEWKKLWMTFFADLAVMTRQEKEAMYQQIDANNSLGEVRGQG